MQRRVKSRNKGIDEYMKVNDRMNNEILHENRYGVIYPVYPEPCCLFETHVYPTFTFQLTKYFLDFV